MKVFIPAAGRGTRLTESRLPKPLESIGSLPMVGRVMSLYPEGTEFVMALGFEKDKIQPVVQLLADSFGHKVKFVYTDSYLPSSLGLTRTIEDSRSELQEPFVFHAVDTLIAEGHLPSFNESVNTVFFANVENVPTEYRTISDGLWIRTRDSVLLSSGAYTGLAHVGDPTSFWLYFDGNEKSAEAGEVLGLDSQNVNIRHLTSGAWLDVGSTSGLEVARSYFVETDVVLPKEDEAIWRFGPTMVKFHLDSEFIEQRVKRGFELLPFVPEASRSSTHTYTYPRAKGAVLSSCSSAVFENFLNHSLDFWFGASKGSGKRTNRFDARYLEFYKDKTLSRVSQFLDQYPSFQGIKSINGFHVPSNDEMLNKIDWATLARILPGRVHGDLHSENVVYDSDSDRFTFLDWRQNLAGSTDAEGDVYYDLAKILHGLIVDHKLMKQGEFRVSFENPQLEFEFMIDSAKREHISIFWDFAREQDFDLSRIQELCALIYLNIAALHHRPYSLLLYGLGSEMIIRDDWFFEAGFGPQS